MAGERTFENLASNSLLSRDMILAHMSRGNIIIDPFNPDNLGTVSYDVALGQHYFREHDLGPLKKFYSPWSWDDVTRVWGKPLQAERAHNLFGEQGMPIPDGINEGDKVIIIGPGETILAHTNEFIGGRNNVTTMMKARSSMGRNFIEVCKCAGWGDVGYINRWTMEITNNSTKFAIPLVVGRRIAQIAFFQVDPFSGKNYAQEGKYQANEEIDKIKKGWVPQNMLPHLWKDREVKG